MLIPSDLRPGAAVVGLEPNIVVTIAANAPAGDANPATPGVLPRMAR